MQTTIWEYKRQASCDIFNDDLAIFQQPSSRKVHRYLCPSFTIVRNDIKLDRQLIEELTCQTQFNILSDVLSVSKQFFQRKCADTRIQLHRTRPATVDTLVSSILGSFPFPSRWSTCSPLRLPSPTEEWSMLVFPLFWNSHGKFHTTRFFCGGADSRSHARAVS